MLGMMALLMTGCKTTEDPGKKQTDDGQQKSSLSLHAGDRVKVDFIGNVTIPSREEEVKEDGTINIEHLGAVQVAGKTTREAEIMIQTNLVPNYYKSLTVTVTAVDRLFFVGGQVTKPGPQHYAGNMTVTKAIQSAGDFTDFANRRNVQITRANGKIETVDYEEATRNPSKDLEIFPHDKVVVDRRF